MKRLLMMAVMGAGLMLGAMAETAEAGRWRGGFYFGGPGFYGGYRYGGGWRRPYYGGYRYGWGRPWGGHYHWRYRW